MITKNIDEITKKDLQELIDNSVLERKTIEYKQSLPGNTDSDKKEFLADVSSFANASGGDLIFGIMEDRNTGFPQKLEGLTVKNIDQEKQRLENMMRDGIEPRILGITPQPVELANKQTALIIRIPKSWIGPHRVTFKGHDKFYSRSSNGKYPMEVSELRVAFNLAETITEKIRKFRTDRISKIFANETPIHFSESAKIVLHLVPITSFNAAQCYDIDTVITHPEGLRPMGCHSWNYRYNLEGLVTYSGAREEKSDSYVLLYRNGIIEAVEGSMLEPDYREQLSIPSIAFERILMGFLKRSLSIQKFLQIELPISIFLTLIGVKDYFMETDKIGRFNGQEIDRDVLFVPEVLLYNFDVDPKKAMRPCFDSVWNACGYSRCLDYNVKGEWISSELLY